MWQSRCCGVRCGCIKVIGVGGGGGNAVNRMIAASVEGVQFIAANTDAQALALSEAPVKLQLGGRLTSGLGAGANPDVGRKAALEDSDKIIEALEESDMVFVTAGLGGGTGTGAAPVIASLASEMGALTVAVVTKPFAFEGKRRMQQAERGMQELLESVDTMIVIPNEKLLAVAKDAGFFESFRIADDVSAAGRAGHLRHHHDSRHHQPRLCRREDHDGGHGLRGDGHGVGSGQDRAVAAARGRRWRRRCWRAGAIDGARGILINITGSSSLKLSEVNAASTIIQSAAHEDANIIFGAVLDESMKDEVKITVIATGFRNEAPHRREKMLGIADESLEISGHRSSSFASVPFASQMQDEQPWPPVRQGPMAGEISPEIAEVYTSPAMPPMATDDEITMHAAVPASVIEAQEQEALHANIDIPAFLRRSGK
jgi:cell division protein FtsZ